MVAANAAHLLELASDSMGQGIFCWEHVDTLPAFARQTKTCFPKELKSNWFPDQEDLFVLSAGGWFHICTIQSRKDPLKGAGQIRFAKNAG